MRSATGVPGAAPLALVLLLATLLGACAPAPVRSTRGVALTIFAASSLREALAAAIAAYEQVAPGASLSLTTDSSATLRTQIEQGAAADLFLAADISSPQQLAVAGLTAGDPVPFARNTLAIVVPASNPARIERPADLGRRGIRIVAAGDEVPISAYAMQLVNRLATLPGYPPGFAVTYASNVVSRETNATAILTKLELGEGDAGIVYLTDALRTDAVRRVEIPPEANVTSTYTGVVIKASSNLAEANAFLAWLAGSAGQAILGDFGFLPLPSP